MIISEPQSCHMPSLRELWKAAFGDTDAFLDMFYATGYAPQRCRCILDGDRVVAVLYWFDCTFEGRKLAYIYAVATDSTYRNQGLCRRLMADTHAHLKQQGYAGAMLLPQDPGLRVMYGKMGYEPCTTVQEFKCEAAPESVPLTELAPEEFAQRRRKLLPPGSVIQELENLAYLAGFSKFYAGPDFLTVICTDGDHAIGYEILGNVTNAPKILRTLGLKSGTFRYFGGKKAFAMFTSFEGNCQKPRYFAFAFD